MPIVTDEGNETQSRRAYAQWCEAAEEEEDNSGLADCKSILILQPSWSSLILLVA